jgi:hypothetical protein
VQSLGLVSTFCDVAQLEKMNNVNKLKVRKIIFIGTPTYY